MPRDRSRSRSRSRSPARDSERDRRRDRDREEDRHRSSSSRKHRHRDDSEDERGHDSDRKERRSSRKHRRHRDDTDDEDDEDDSDDSSDDDRRSRKKKKGKDRKKKRESSEDREKRARKKARKRMEKEAAARATEEQRQAAAELSLYSTLDNPFNDANLTDQFVWGKKREQEKKQGVSDAEARRRDAERRAEAKEELERLNKRRADREVEMALREEEQMRAARAAESAQMDAWHAKEDDFHLEQSMRRAEIRMREGRAKPIDLLALNLKWSKPRVEGENGEDEEEDDGLGLDVDLEEPYLIFDNLTLEETEELYEDIQMYISLEKDESNLEFWRSMIVVCSSALETLRTERSMGRAAFLEQNRANEAVKADITNLLRNKSLSELRELQDSVRAKLSSGDPIDVEYWEGLLKELAVWMAKAKLRAMHEVVLRNRLEHLRRRQRDEAVRVQNELADAVEQEEAQAEEEQNAGAASSSTQAEPSTPAVAQDQWDDAMAPRLVTRIPQEDQHLKLVSPEEELRTLIAARRLVAHARFVPKRNKSSNLAAVGDAGDAEADALVRAAASKGLDEDEEVWQAKSELRGQTYSWQDKYRPRKPRYFNKVITGYEWNKYNQTHYDVDNPPPKVVQAYRFTIFAPDLVDPTKAPTYKVIREPGNNETCILHFKIGPPYEDLAFRIVNKEWEYSHKRGFKSTFDRGVLQLNFNFRRNFYRK